MPLDPELPGHVPEQLLLLAPEPVQVVVVVVFAANA
jgi:hypothetical protein